MVELVHDLKILQARVGAWKAAGERVGFIPTMGALHDGHLSLMRAARAECRRVVVSIFVNPTQFGPGEDLALYPRTLEADLALCGGEADLVYAPAAETMYPEPAGRETWVLPGPGAEGLCGRFRPGHFRGVLTVVDRLFRQVAPDLTYFGAKDYQQAVLVRGMVRDRRLPLEVRIRPTVREPDGLAMSSRNRYLNPPQRHQALCLIRGLRAAEALAARGTRDAATLKAAIAAEVGRIPEAQVDYIEIVDPESLAPVARLDGPAVAALALRIGGTRLIDNLTLVPA